MKKLFSIFLVSALLCTYQSCKTAEDGKYEQILKTKNISLIEDFLKDSHEQDPRKPILKQRLIALKNAQLKNSTEKARQLVAKPTFKEIPKNLSSNIAEVEEFSKLMSTDTSKEHQEKTVKLLNALFDQDITSKEVILLVQNKSDCNMILRLEGKTFYNIAIPSHGENSLVLPKGDYALSSNVCDVKYNSTKKINKNMLVTLSNPTVVNKFGTNAYSTKAQK